MLTLRLQRIGKAKRPTYRLIVSEKKHDTQYGCLENLGIYNPIEKTKIVDFKADRIKYWLSVGAQTSETVNNLLINAGIITGAKRKAVKISKKRQTKIVDKKKTVEEAKKKAEEKKIKAEEDAKAKADAEAAKVVEETKVESVSAEATPDKEVEVETPAVESAEAKSEGGEEPKIETPTEETKAE